MRAAFEDAVEDYLETCAALGKSPEKPASGKLMLRIRAGEEAENNRGLSPNTPTNTPEPLWGTDDFRAILGRTQIDYDPDKEKINRKKHGYSLESAVYFLTGLIIPGAYRPFLSRKVLEKNEIRHEHLTIDDSKNVVLFVTTMRDRETVRIISLRRAHENEVRSFHEYLATFVNEHS